MGKVQRSIEEEGVTISTHLGIAFGRGLFLDNILQEQADVSDGNRGRQHLEGFDGVDGTRMRFQKTQGVPDAL